MATPEENETEPTPVKGWLIRPKDGGGTERIDFTVDEVRNADAHYTEDDLVNIEVELSNGSVIRPYRFASSSVVSVDKVDPETGETISVHY